jgi:small subunit ribosomal protein S16
MSVKIRLSRIGKKHAPFYRIVSIDSRKKRDGAFLEDLGTFDAIKGIVVRFDESGYSKRLEQGAIPSDAVKKIYALFKSNAPTKVQEATAN